jgi:hypothetical protein
VAKWSGVWVGVWVLDLGHESRSLGFAASSNEASLLEKSRSFERTDSPSSYSVASVIESIGSIDSPSILFSQSPPELAAADDEATETLHRPARWIPIDNDLI